MQAQSSDDIGEDVDVQAPDLDSVQRRASHTSQPDDASVHDHAARGIAGAGTRQPHADKIQDSFGRHDISNVTAHVGGVAARASDAIGAEAYALGTHTAYRREPDLHTAAHEATHAIQQRAGVQLAGGVGQAGDVYEQHADRVADLVVAGQSAEATLGEMAGDGASSSSLAPPGRALERASQPPNSSVAVQKHDTREDDATEPTRLQLSERTLEFADLEMMFVSDRRTVTVTNNGYQAEALDIDGSVGDHTDFRIYGAPTIQSMALEPGQSEQLEIEFRPTETGCRQASWFIGNGAAAVRLTAFGEGLANVCSSTVDNAPTKSAADVTKEFQPGGAGNVDPDAAMQYTNWPSEGKVGRVFSEGHKVYAVADTNSTPIARLKANTLAYIEKVEGAGWLYITTDKGVSGYIADFGYHVGKPKAIFVNEISPADPGASIYQIKGGDTALGIAGTQYAPYIRAGHDARYFIGVLAWANGGGSDSSKGIYHKGGKHVTNWEDNWFSSSSWEEAGVRANYWIWIPTASFAKGLENQITDGSLTNGLWSKVKDIAEIIAGGAAFIAGLVVGAVSSIIDLVKGLAELPGIMVKLIRSIISGSIVSDVKSLLSSLSEMSLGELGAILAPSLGNVPKKWNEGNLLEKWYYRGKVVGYVLAEVLMLIFTGGATAAKIAAKVGKIGKLSSVGKFAAKATKIVDKGGDAIKLAKAKIAEKAGRASKIGKGADRGGDVARGGKAGDKASDTGKASKADNKPKDRDNKKKDKDKNEKARLKKIARRGWAAAKRATTTEVKKKSAVEKIVRRVNAPKAKLSITVKGSRWSVKASHRAKFARSGSGWVGSDAKGVKWLAAESQRKKHNDVFKDAEKRANAAAKKLRAKNETAVDLYNALKPELTKIENKPKPKLLKGISFDIKESASFKSVFKRNKTNSAKDDELTYDAVISPNDATRKIKVSAADQALEDAHKHFGAPPDKCTMFSRKLLEKKLKKAARGYITDWKKAGLIHTYASHTNDPSGLYTFDPEAAGKRDINHTNNSRARYGYVNPKWSDSEGVKILSKGLRIKGEQGDQSYDGKWSKAPINKTDPTFHAKRAWYDSQDSRGSTYKGANAFRRAVAILGHIDPPGCVGHWNKTGHKQDKAANKAWCGNSANYWGPEHRKESSASGGAEKRRYVSPCEDAGSAKSWWFM